MKDWRRAIVRVWHHAPSKRGVYLGSAFFIAPRYLVTAKHVVEDFLGASEVKEIRLTGAWKEGDVRRVREVIPHPGGLDVALLFLEKPVEDASIIPFEQTELSTLKQGEEITLAGFTSGERGIEVITLRISAYDGDYDLEVAQAPVGKGMSGGPALRDEKLVGITRAKDDSHTYVIRLDAFWNFIKDILGEGMLHALLQPVTVEEMAELKRILLGVHIQDVDALEYFKKTLPDSRPPDHNETDIFGSCLAFLAQKEHAPPAKAPLLEYLEYCHTKIKQQVTSAQLAHLGKWKVSLASRLGVDLAAVQSRVRKSMLTATAGSVGVLLKIEPLHLVSKERFTLTAWTHHNGKFEPQDIPEQDDTKAGFNRDDLERNLPKILTRSLRQLGGEAQNAVVEIIAPFDLFDWKVSRLPIAAGPLSLPLGKLYSLAFRSWDRIYHDSYDATRHQWSARWVACPHRLQAGQIHQLLEVKARGQTFYDELTPNIYVLLALSPIPRTQAVDLYREVIGVALAAGLPFAFWSLQPCAEDQLREISNELYKYDVTEWPCKLKLWRASDDSFWHDVQMLWDNPENLPPDTGYTLVMYD